jgi:hypothetical protein
MPNSLHQAKYVILCLSLFLIFKSDARNNSPSAPRVIYVDFNSNGANNGTSWLNAYKQLFDALNAAAEGDQIWVVGGVYYPTISNDRNVSFTIKRGVAIYGAFLGTESSVQERRPNMPATRLSGDIGVWGDSTDNSYHVLKVENPSFLTLDYVYIEKGNANGQTEANKKGGGLYMACDGERQVNIALTNFRITDCRADTEGGGLPLFSKWRKL